MTASHSRPLAIVTGTSRGLGAAVARALLSAGWSVCGFARGETAEELEDPHYRHFRLDLADTGAVERLFEGELAKDGELRAASRVGLVNNAGVLDIEATDETRMEHLVRSFAVNSAVPTWLMGWCLRQVPATTPLRIVNLSSGAATRAYPGWSAYCASKAALEMAGDVLAEELAERPALLSRDVSVVSYAPGVVATEMQAAIRAADEGSFPRRARFEELHAQGQLVAPEEPAAEIARLLTADGLPPHSQLRYAPPAPRG